MILGEKRRQHLLELEALAESITADISDVVAFQQSQNLPIPSASGGTHAGSLGNDLCSLGTWATTVGKERTQASTAPSLDPRLLISRNNQEWTLSFFDCGCTVPHIEIAATSDGMKNALRAIAAVSLPADPYLNAIRIERICLVEAMKTNCLQIGITDTAFCADDSISPFFRLTDSNHGNDSLVRTVQGIFRTVRPDLRPTEKQITSIHHPFVDILPFPVLRDNLITCIDDASIDEDEFFYDALNGLICWGGAGISRRDKNGIGSGTPWDVRSWEAKEWFIQKWWFILGGEEGELVRQSRWWRSLRGEDLDTSELLC